MRPSAGTPAGRESRPDDSEREGCEAAVSDAAPGAGRPDAADAPAARSFGDSGPEASGADRDEADTSGADRDEADSSGAGSGLDEDEPDGVSDTGPLPTEGPPTRAPGQRAAPRRLIRCAPGTMITEGGVAERVTPCHGHRPCEAVLWQDRDSRGEGPATTPHDTSEPGSRPEPGAAGPWAKPLAPGRRPAAPG
ncbi:hypothetical protein K388_06633 [Streptomyces sp. KhCrAH-43]|nr:hypothetical protein K388_06633 [Streptomyces sp. KhCrAH-43]